MASMAIEYKDMQTFDKLGSGSTPVARSGLMKFEIVRDNKLTFSHTFIRYNKLMSYVSCKIVCHILID